MRAKVRYKLKAAAAITARTLFNPNAKHDITEVLRAESASELSGDTLALAKLAMRQCQSGLRGRRDNAAD